MTIPCRVPAHAAADGPANMATDEALLGAVADDPTAAAFRTYEWAEPTLSLGYFQSVADAEAEPRWRGVPLVRRPTGGGAIWHHHEVTYAVALPASHPLARRTADLYRAIHGAIAGALRDRDVPADRRGEAGPGARAGRAFLCFADRDPEDIVLGGAKVVGSAQRRRSGAVLQHGSLLLARSARTPELPGLAELSDAPADATRWAILLRSVIPEALGLAPLVEGPPPGLPARVAELERGTYRQKRWNRRR